MGDLDLKGNYKTKGNFKTFYAFNRKVQYSPFSVFGFTQ